MFGACQAGIFLNANEKRGTQSGVSFLAPTMTFSASFHGDRWSRHRTRHRKRLQNERFQNVLFFMFPVARFQSKTNEKLICLLEHLSIDVVKLRLGLYGWNPRIHQATVCDMCQNERFWRHSKRAIFHVSCCSFSIKNKWKANLSFGAPQHWCCQASIRFVWLESKNPSSNGVRHVPKWAFLKALKTCYFSCFLLLVFNQKQTIAIFSLHTKMKHDAKMVA